MRQKVVHKRNVEAKLRAKLLIIETPPNFVGLGKNSSYLLREDTDLSWISHQDVYLVSPLRKKKEGEIRHIILTPVGSKSERDRPSSGPCSNL